MSHHEIMLRDALRTQPRGLAEHVLRVVEEARRLAAAHDVDVEDATIAALGHDLLRAEPPERLLEIARQQGRDIDPVERAEPILLHGPLAVPLLREQFGIVDGYVLRAVAHHTTAASGMSDLEKVIFIADKVEHDKMKRDPYMEVVRDLAFDEGLDQALLAFLEHYLEMGRERGWTPHPRTLAARDEARANLGLGA